MYTVQESGISECLPRNGIKTLWEALKI